MYFTDLVLAAYEVMSVVVAVSAAASIIAVIFNIFLCILYKPYLSVFG
jgi:hypothetical protein